MPCADLVHKKKYETASNVALEKKYFHDNITLTAFMSGLMACRSILENDTMGIQLDGLQKQPKRTQISSKLLLE